MRASAQDRRSRWSTPISPAARSTISSASPCRRCCGASCRAPARPAACNRWRCASSAPAKPRSKPSRPGNIGRIDARSRDAKGGTFEARLVSVDGKKLEKFDIADRGRRPAALKTALEGAHFAVDQRRERPAGAIPAPPFTTSTLQQEASRKLGFSPRQTMQVAQRLYEGVDLGGETVGLITYMRTDGVQIVPEAIAAARAHIVEKRSGRRYLPHAPRDYKTKAKNAQEAHEAIRPTDFEPPAGEGAARSEAGQTAKLYKLIWQRAVASQMASAELERTTVDIEATRNGRRSIRPARHRLRHSVRRLPEALRGRHRRQGRRGRRRACRS